jgi:hypothetical protein
MSICNIHLSLIYQGFRIVGYSSGLISVSFNTYLKQWKQIGKCKQGSKKKKLKFKWKLNGKRWDNRLFMFD